nr:MerR family transcriptional regulator [Bifidobacterium bifidum]
MGASRCRRSVRCLHCHASSWLECKCVRRVILAATMSSMERYTIREVADMSIEYLKRFFAFEADEPEHIDDIVALLEDRRAAIEERRRTLDEAYAHVLRKLHYYGIRPISAAAARPPLRPFGDTAPAGIHGKTMKPHTVYRPCGQHDCCRSRRKSRRI